MKKGITLMFVVVFVSAFYLGIVAAPNLQEVKVNMDYGMKMLLHGQPFNPVDTNTGISYRPILYKNKIYLPAREVCYAANLSIEYDSQNNVLNIGEHKEYAEVGPTQFKSHFSTSFTKDADLLFTPNKTFKYGIVKNPISSEYYGAVITPGGKYSKFSTSLYLGDTYNKPVTFDFCNTLNRELLKSVTVKPGETVKVEFDIVGIDTLDVMNQGSLKNCRIVIGEPQFK